MSDLMTSTNGNGRDVRELARQMFRADPGLRREDVAAELGMSPRWVGTIKAEVKAEVRNGAAGAVPATVADGPREASPSARTKPTVSRTAARRGKPRWPLVALVALAVVAGLMVLVVTAVISYTHVRHLADIAGQADLAAWYPLGVDGLVAVCSGVLLWDRHAGRPVSWVARIGAGLGLVATFVANGMAYDPDLASVYVAGLILAVYPPVALAVVWHLLNRMLVER